MEKTNDFLELEINEEFNEEELKRQSEDLLELRYITKDNSLFKRTEGGFVSLEYNGKFYDRVGVYRTFPLTEPDEFISIREANEKAREIGMIENINKLPKDQSEMIREQLRLRYFTPQIEQVIDVKDEYGYAYFNVKTNFGTCRFTIHMGGDTVIALSENRILINDLDGNRYEIPNIEALSITERKKLDLFI